MLHVEPEIMNSDIVVVDRVGKLKEIVVLAFVRVVDLDIK